MKHRDPAKYKQFIGDKNIIVEDGELVYVEKPYKGWSSLDGTIFRNRKEAIKYATKLNQLIKWNKQRIINAKLKY